MGARDSGDGGPETSIAATRSGARALRLTSPYPIARGGTIVDRTRERHPAKEATMNAPTASDPAAAHDRTVSALYTEGFVSGIIGAATVALWFLILDTARGRPLSTPSILGTLIFQGPRALTSPESIPLSLEMVLAFTWIHGLLFCAFGGLAAWLISLAEENPSYGYGIVLLMILFLFGFIVVSMLFAEPLLSALTWPAILIGNVLAVGAMGAYFWRRHPRLSILP